ncbi:Ohr family peroxiredoxin [Herbidospora sp. NEAU-GS84]|uniref:Ohr family peroxiredoxin n=1 Tax=Herbidospora solisilvae TaxID=2696284 RepID=A0A7C9N0H8_9ACTN|nr:Ohr family peroxiredoxin [Herbidospora solisilvae]NAS22229.1 Ohr family peroxiredoxin [Herbidospora solisilvae]
MTLYVTSVTVTGGSSAHGRATGRAVSADGALDLELRLPRELGGDSGGPNPEQLFAAAYAACFQAALSLAARRHHLDPSSISVAVTVAFGRDPADDGYQVRADLAVTWPDADPDVAALLVARAEALCPYTKMSPATISLSVDEPA